MPGGATLVATMKQHGAYCALVSGGFTYFTALVRQALGFDFDAANVLKHDGAHARRARSNRRSWARKPSLRRLQRLAAEHGLSPRPTP